MFCKYCSKEIDLTKENIEQDIVKCPKCGKWLKINETESNDRLDIISNNVKTNENKISLNNYLLNKKIEHIQTSINFLMTWLFGFFAIIFGFLNYSPKTRERKSFLTTWVVAIILKIVFGVIVYGITYYFKK